jgi:uncharacterized membrane protein
MVQLTTVARTRTALGQGEIRYIDAADLGEALARGFDDFKAMPSHFLFLSLIYPVIGLFLARIAIGNDVLPLLFPLAAGFALIGPFAAIGLYELSRRREQGEEPYLWHGLAAFQARSMIGIATVGAVLAVIFVAWLIAAEAVYQVTLGPQPPASIGAFVRDVLTTPAGWALIVLGNGLGFLFAVLALSLSVVSMPLLLDRDVSALTAMETSLRAMLVNPKAMAMWGSIVAGGLVIGCVPCFLGLVVVMPILGHSSWHLYRKVIES